MVDDGILGFLGGDPDKIAIQDRHRESLQRLADARNTTVPNIAQALNDLRDQVGNVNKLMDQVEERTTADLSEEKQEVQRLVFAEILDDISDAQRKVNRTKTKMVRLAEAVDRLTDKALDGVDDEP